MKDVLTQISKDFTAAGNYAQLVSKFPPGSASPRAFETLTGALLTTASLTGGPLVLQVLFGDNIWRTVGASLTAQSSVYLFSIESFITQNRGLVLYGARFNLAAALTGGTSVIYSEITGA